MFAARPLLSMSKSTRRPAGALPRGWVSLVKHLNLLVYFSELWARAHDAGELAELKRDQRESLVDRSLRTPGQQAVLDHGQQPFGDQRHHRDHDHGGEYPVGIERALGGCNQ
jgi:hypothetical protein